MSINESKMERIAGLVLAALSAAFFFGVLPAQIRYIPDVYPTPRTFPQIITGVLFTLSILLFLSGWRKRRQEGQKVFTFSAEQAKLVGVTLFSMAVYVVLLPIITYIPATILLLAVLVFAYGQRNWYKLGVLSLALPVCIYVAFTVFMRLRLP